MSRTLLLYDGKMSSAERIAQTLCCLIGNSNAAEISDVPQNFADYDGYCFVFNFYGAVTAGRTRAFLTGHRDVLAEKRIAFVGIGFSDIGYAKYVSDTETAAGIAGIAGYFISSESDTPRTGYEIGKMMRAPVNVMPEVQLERAIDDFIIEHNTLCLATADEGYVRCTPLEYIFLEHRLYIITEGGNKFRGIFGNGQISAAIFDPYVSTEDVRGLQIMGNAELVADDSVEYFTVLEQKEITADSLAAMPVKLFVVRITPYSYEFTDSAFVRDGYDAKQIMETDFLRENWEAGALYAEHATAAGNKAVSGRVENLKAADTASPSFQADAAYPAGDTSGQGPQEEAAEEAADNFSETEETPAGSDKRYSGFLEAGQTDTEPDNRYSGFSESEQAADESENQYSGVSENEQTGAEPEKAAHAPEESEASETWQASSVTEPAKAGEEPEASEENQASADASASDQNEETDEDSDAFLEAEGDVARQASDAEEAIRKETAAAEDGSDLKREAEAKTDTDGLPVLDMSVIDGLVPGAEKSGEDGADSSEYDEDDLSAKKSLLSRISQKRSLDEEREERREKKKDRKKSGESVGSRLKSWFEDFDDDDDDDEDEASEDSAEPKDAEGRRTYSFYEKDEKNAPDVNTPEHETPSGAESALSDENEGSAEEAAVSPEEAAEETVRETAAEETDKPEAAEERREAKPARKQPKEKNGSFLSRLGHTIGTFLSVDEEDTSEDDEDDDEEDDEDDFSFGQKPGSEAVKSSRSERTEKAVKSEAHSEEEKEEEKDKEPEKKEPEKKEAEKKKPEKKRSVFHGMTSRRAAVNNHPEDDLDDDDLDDDLDDLDDDFGDEEDEEFEEEISKKSGPGVRDDEAVLESDDVDARYARMLDHGKEEKKHGETALPSFLRNVGRKVEERIAADKEKEKERETAGEENASADDMREVSPEENAADQGKADSGDSQDGHDQRADATDDASAEALSPEEPAAQTRDGESEEHITADEEEVVNDADEADTDAEETGDEDEGGTAPDGVEAVFDFSVDDEPYEEDQDSDQYPEDEVVENMNDTPADEEVEDADVTPASDDEIVEDADVTPVSDDETARDADVTPVSDDETVEDADVTPASDDEAAEDADVTPASDDEVAEDAGVTTASADETAKDADATSASDDDGPDQGDGAFAAAGSTAADQPYGTAGAAQSADAYGSRSSGNGSYYASHDMSELTGSHTSAPSDEPRRTSAGPDIPEFMMKRNTAAHRHTRAQDFKDDLAVHDSGEERREREAKNAAIDAAVREARGSGHTVDVSGKASGGRRRKKKHRR